MASSTEICKVLGATPSSATLLGLAERELVVPLAAPVVKVTLAVFVTPAKAAVTTTAPAAVLFMVTEQMPEVLVLHVVALNV